MDVRREARAAIADFIGGVAQWSHPHPMAL
jgi:hypothetical protein